MGSAGLVEALEDFQHGKRGQLSCARILAEENLPLAPKKRMCIAIALLLHRIGEEGKKVRGAWDKSGGSGCVSWRARRARPLGAVNGWDFHKYTTTFSELQGGQHSRKVSLKASMQTRTV
jgi:hypothetical protein